MTLLVAEISLPGCATRIGVDDPTPLVAWRLAGDGAQSAYQIQVGTTAAAADVLDTGKTVSDMQMVEVRAQLRSSTRYYMRARVWDETDTVSDWVADWWESGLWGSTDWRGAQWIGRPGTASPQLRRDVALDGPVLSARLYVATCGYAEVAVNGHVISDPLSPGFVVYTRRAQYVTYDITEVLADSASAVVGITLGRGWFGVDTVTDWAWHDAPWHGDPRCKVLLAVTTATGVSYTTSGSSWSVIGGPTVTDSVYLGDSYDARLETPGWLMEGFDDSTWSAATVMTGPRVCTAMLQPAITASDPITASTLTEISPGVWRATFPSVMAGWVRVAMTTAADTPVSIAYAERLTTGGALYMANGAVEGTAQTDTYVSAGGAAIWEPRFSYKGFRYVEIRGALAVTSIEAIEVRTALPEAGEFSSSDPTLDRLATMAHRTLAINTHGIITDTPQREKNGWLGDAMVTCESMLYAYNAHALYRKWLTDMADSVRSNGWLPDIIPHSGNGVGSAGAPDWGSAFVLLAHRLWQLTGDISIAAQRFYEMKRYVDRFLTQTSNAWLMGYGDWSAPDGNESSGGKDMSGTSVVVRQTLAFADLCDALGVDSTSYRSRCAAVIAEARDRLMNPDGTWRPAADYSGATKDTPTVLGIAYGWTPENLRSSALTALATAITGRGGHHNCGILGAEHLYHVLTDGGAVDTAYQALTNPSLPGVGYQAAVGATTTWNSIAVGELSQGTLSHHMHTTYLSWLYRDLAGIRISDPGTVLIDPHRPPGLDSVTATLALPRGAVTVTWDADSLTITTPPGITAFHAGTAYHAGAHYIPIGD